MAEKSVSVRDVINEFAALGRQHAGLLAVVTLAIAAGYSVLDLFTHGMGSSIASLIVGIFVQFLVVERLLADRLPEGTARIRRYGAMLSSAILSGLAIAVGFIVFIVPGLILMAAWSASTAFIVVEGISGPKALGASWEATKGSRTALTLIVGIAFVAMIGAVMLLFGGLYFWADPLATGQTYEEGGPVEIVSSSVIVSAYSVAGWLFGAAVYRLVNPAGEQFDEVFA